MALGDVVNPFQGMNFSQAQKTFGAKPPGQTMNFPSATPEQQAQTAQSDTAQGWDFPGNPTGSNPNPGYIDPAMQQQIATRLGLVGADYNQNSGDLRNAYGLDRQQQQLKNQMIGLDNTGINSQIAGQNADTGYRNQLINSYQGDLGTFNADKQTLGQMLTNTQSANQQDRRMADFATNNKYIAGGGQFTPGMGINLGNNAFTQNNKNLSAQYQNDMSQRGVDRSISGTNLDISGAQNAITQNNLSIDQLHNSLAKNGLQLKAGDVSMQQLQQQFQQRLDQLGISRGLDTQKVFSDAAGGDAQKAAAAIAFLKQTMPDLIASSGIQ